MQHVEVLLDVLAGESPEEDEQDCRASLVMFRKNMFRTPLSETHIVSLKSRI